MTTPPIEPPDEPGPPAPPPIEPSDEPGPPAPPLIEPPDEPGQPTPPPIEPPDEPGQPTTPPIQPPDEPGQPAGPGPALPAPRYETRTLVITTVATVLALTLLTVVFFPLGLLAPLTLVVALFFIRTNASAHRRSIVTGVILGAGIGLLTTAGVCTAIINGIGAA